MLRLEQSLIIAENRLLQKGPPSRALLRNLKERLLESLPSLRILGKEAAGLGVTALYYPGAGLDLAGALAVGLPNALLLDPLYLNRKKAPHGYSERVLRGEVLALDPSAVFQRKEKYSLNAMFSVGKHRYSFTFIRGYTHWARRIAAASGKQALAMLIRDPLKSSILNPRGHFPTDRVAVVGIEYLRDLSKHHYQGLRRYSGPLRRNVSTNTEFRIYQTMRPR